MLKLEQVGLELGGRKIFSGVNLELKSEESVAVIGPSGTGKTLLLKVAAGLIPPTQGKIFIFGQDLATVSLREKQMLLQKLGFSFQQSALFDFLDLESNLGFPLKESFDLEEEEITWRVRELSKELGLADALKKMPSELSGGMKKRVSLGRAIIHQPKLLLCDDPTAGLDPITAAQISDLIVRLRQKIKFSLLLVSNELSVIKKLSERVYLLYQGSLREIGSANALEFKPDQEWGELSGEDQ